MNDFKDSEDKKLELMRLKNEINELYKVTYLSIGGVKLYSKDFGLADILKDMSKNKYILDVAAYKVFNFDAMKKYLEATIKGLKGKSREKEIKKFEENKKEFEKLKDICTNANRQILDLKNEYTFPIKTNLRLIKIEDIEKIKQIDQYISNELKKIDFDKIQEVLSSAKSTLKAEALDIFQKYNIEYGTNNQNGQRAKELLDKKFEKLPTKDTIINNIKVKKIILDISDEFLNSDDLSEVLLKFIEGDKKTTENIKNFRKISLSKK